MANHNPLANLDSVKQYNLMRLFRIIVEYGLISRTQLTEVSNLAAGSVTKLTRLLIEHGLVHEVAQQQSERGRKAILLAPKSDDIQVLAARADRKHLHVGLCDLSGNLLHRVSLPLSANSEAEFVEQITGELAKFLADNAGLIRQIVGIGITMPGLVDADRGVVNFMPHVPVQELPLAEIISSALNLPCYINSFASAMALAEKQIGASFHSRNNVFIEVHNGVGAGLILNDDLYSGTGVGEIGHIQVDPLGKPCVCGNYGCLETVVSDQAIVDRFNQRRQLVDAGAVDVSSIDQVLSAAADLDESALSVLKEAAAHIGTAMATVVNLFRPDCIVLAGAINQAWGVIQPVMEQQLKTKSLQVHGVQPVKLMRSDIYDSPWYSGYALVRQALLQGGILHTLFTDE